MKSNISNLSRPTIRQSYTAISRSVTSKSSSHTSESIFESFRYQGKFFNWVAPTEYFLETVNLPVPLNYFFVFDKIQFITNVRVQAVPKL